MTILIFGQVWGPSTPPDPPYPNETLVPDLIQGVDIFRNLALTFNEFKGDYQ
jgi:hypothetical protein